MNEIIYAASPTINYENVTLEAQSGHQRNTSLVDFDGAEDPANPLNWSPVYKWSIVGLISVMSLVVNLAILMCAPATPQVLAEFHSSSQLESTILVSIWELGEVFGPLIVAPLSEISGRLPVYHTANFMFIIFSIAAAKSTNINMLIAFRFFLGLSVASTTLNPCIVGDMFKQKNRGRALAVMGMMAFVAPVLGPTVGGFISEAMGWRWTFWLTAIITGGFQICFLATYRESYKVTILERKARCLRKKSGNDLLRSRYDTGVSSSRLLGQSLARPVNVLFSSPIVLLVSICGAFATSYTYIIITSLTRIFEDTYGFSTQLVGLAYLGLGIGMMLSVIFCGLFLDSHLKRKSTSGLFQPEYRLPPMVLGTILVPLGLITFGWTAQTHIHWTVPILSTAVVGFGFVAVSLASCSYLVDTFGIHAASATAATTVLRNVSAAVLPLAGPALYGKLGLGRGNTVLGGVALVSVPVPMLLMKHGERMRTRNENQATA